METYDLTQEQLAERVGKSRSHVANMLRALSAPQALQDAVLEGKISEGHLRALLPLPLSDAITALGEILARELSVRDAEALVRKMVHPTARRGRARARVLRGDPDLAQLTNELRAALGTKVEILRRRRGGRIQIEFYNDEDFERLYEMFIRAGKA
jgi:ParB family chromosome partitioning protein